MTENNSKGHINPNYIKEWEIARKLLTKFDDHSYDLRKYGFTFITALLTVESFLLPHYLSTNPDTGAITAANLPDAIKFAVLLVNLLLIIAITVIDRNFYIIQIAAASRAKVLERILNLELTEIITQRFRGNKAEDWFTGLYCFFSAIVILLGYFVLYPNYFALILLSFVGVGVIFSIRKIRTDIKIDWPYGPADYSIDGVNYSLGDSVEITITNLGEKVIKAEKDDIIWQIKNQDNILVYNQKAGTDFNIPEGGSYTRFWETNSNTNPKIEVKKGIYSLYRAIIDDTEYIIKKEEGLKSVPRKIRLYRKESE